MSVVVRNLGQGPIRFTFTPAPQIWHFMSHLASWAVLRYLQVIDEVTTSGTMGCCGQRENSGMGIGYLWVLGM